MQITCEHQGRRYSANLGNSLSLAITLQFDGPQPNHFAAPVARSAPLQLGDFVGDTSAGGSCNVGQLQLIPHCNGTHTETVSHIVDEDVWAGHAAAEPLCVAAVISVPITAATNTSEPYRPALADSDHVITAEAIRQALQTLHRHAPTALIIRTLPNESDKKQRKYADPPQPAFFTCPAMEVINDLGCRHLLVDLPSVDRMYDDGLLTNHHLFWSVPEGTHRLTPDSRQDKTITEMIFVPESVPDGICLLSVQIPALGGDAAPSRPILIPVDHTEDLTRSP